MTLVCHLLRYRLGATWGEDKEKAATIQPEPETKSRGDNAPTTRFAQLKSFLVEQPVLLVNI